MNLTRVQQEHLWWLAEAGGSGLVDRYGAVVARGERLVPPAAITFLRLVTLGLVEGGYGRLSLTARGREEAARIDGDRREAQAKLACLVEKWDKPEGDKAP